MDENKLNEFFSMRKQIRTSGKNKTYGFDLPYKHFLMVMYAWFTSQSYSGRIEKRIIRDLGLKKISSRLDRGDCINSNGKYGEIKISYKNIDEQFSFVQVRPHQDLDFYLLQCIDPDDDFKLYNFFLTKNEMLNFLEMFNGSNCHGVVEFKNDRSQEEKRITVVFNDDGWKFLIDNYLEDNIKEKIDNF